MTIHLSTCLEDELRRLAGLRGTGVDLLVEEAVRQYLDALAITDVGPEEVGAAQTALAAELRELPESFLGTSMLNDSDPR